MVDVNILGHRGSGSGRVGAIAAYNHGLIEECYSTGKLYGPGSGTSTGGIAGRNVGAIRNCYSTADVKGDIYIGGIVGINYATIKNNYSIGNVTSRLFGGGLYGGWGHQSNSFYPADTTTIVCGSRCYISAEHGASTSTEIKDVTFLQNAGWDFENIWAETEDYPKLAWENTSSTEPENDPPINNNVYLDESTCIDSDSTLSSDQQAKTFGQVFITSSFHLLRTANNFNSEDYVQIETSFDTCKSTNTLIEKFCDGDSIGHLEVNCPNDCNMGACQ